MAESPNGCSLGDALGDTVVGDAVGDALGDALGDSDGAVLLGDALGALVGAALGTTMHLPHCGHTSLGVRPWLGEPGSSCVWSASVRSQLCWLGCPGSYVTHASVAHHVTC
jgi:hypothetical protein